MDFLTMIGVGAITYFVWKIADQLQDLLFRVAEIQRELGEIKRAESGIINDEAAQKAGDV